MTRSFLVPSTIGLAMSFALSACGGASKEPDARPVPVVVPAPTGHPAADGPARGSEPITVIAAVIADRHHSVSAQHRMPT